MNLLFFGDVCGEIAAQAFCRALPSLRREFFADLVVVNVENICNDNGTLPQLCEEVLFAGADVLTGGNHTLRHREMCDYLDSNARVLRPENLSAKAGMGHVIVRVGEARVLVANFLGNAYRSDAAPLFASCERLLRENEGRFDVAVCDLHAEATAEKGAFFHAFSDVFSVIVGTHTHVPTADLTVQGGCGFLTDLGMVGAKHSVLGVKVEESIRRFRTGEPLRYAPPEQGDISLCGALFTLDETLRCTFATQILRTL